MAEVDGGVVRELLCGVAPEVEGVAVDVALEALEAMVLEVGGEASAGA